MNRILLIVVFVFAIIVNTFVLNNHYSNLLILLWILSILIYVISFRKKFGLSKFHFSKVMPSRSQFLLLLVILLPVLVRAIFIEMDRIHQDEYILAYFSTHFDFAKNNFFAPVPFDKREWIAHYPSIFFVFQKMYFGIFRENFFSVKFSCLPYVLLTSCGIYLVTKTLLDKKSAVISVIFYAFFAPAIYFETLSIHNYAPVGIFLLMFYLILKNYQRTNLTKASLLGVLCGFCYLIHSAAFLALPFMIIFYIYEFLFGKMKINVVKKLLVSLFGFLIVIFPFFIYALVTKDFYFWERMNQINLFNGTWSPFRDQIARGLNPAYVLIANFLTAFKSLYLAGVGGDQGYNFSHMALFDQLNLILLLAGLFIGIFLLIKRLDFFWIYFLIFVNFFAGVVMTIPPPSFQRLIVNFPFFVIFMSLPVYFVLKIKPKNVGLIVAFLIIFLYSYTNILYFKQAKAQDDYESIRLVKEIENNFSTRKIYIAAFPSFALQKIFYFSRVPNVKNVNLQYHETLLRNFNKNEKYVYVILFPREFVNKFREQDPSGRMIDYSETYSLFVN